MALRFSTICARMRAHAIYLGEGLLFPPATEAEIDAAEARLGFTLPPMLRELYTTVANGSDFFGWGYDFYTISDKFVGYGSGYPVLGEIMGDGPRPFDDATVEALRAHPGAYIVCEDMPTGFVDFASLGCEVHAYLDGFTGHIYISDNHGTNGVIDGLSYSFGASSLEEWLERRLSFSRLNSDEARYQPHHPLADALAAEAVHPGEQEGDGNKAPRCIRWGYNEISGYHAHQWAGLNRARAVITQHIYDLDSMQESIVDRDVNDRPEPYDTSDTMQQLADIEAQLDNLMRNAW